MSINVNYDDDLIAVIDDAKGWVKNDGSSPSKTARDLGAHCKFIGPMIPAWESGGVWSVCILAGIRTTLLARSYDGLIRLYRKLKEREADDADARWMSYYSAMWERRYRRWVCDGVASCDCQLHRIAAGAL